MNYFKIFCLNEWDVPEQKMAITFYFHAQEEF